MVYGQWNHKVHTFLPQRAAEPLTEGIGLETLRWRFEDSRAYVTDILVKLRGENTIPVVQKKTVAMVRWERFAQLLKRPGGRGMRRHITVQDAPRRVFHNHKHIEETKGRGGHHVEVARDDHLGMITHKGAPALECGAFASTTLEAFGHVLSDRPWRHAQAQLEQ